jgi:hypothetical protein
MVYQSFFGAEWALFPPHDSQGYLNIVGESEDEREIEIIPLIGKRLCHIIFLNPGDDPFHPTAGFSPKLFESLNSRTHTYFVFHASQELNKWNQLGYLGCKTIEVAVDPQTVYTNSIAVDVNFTPFDYEEKNVLSFGYFQPKTYYDKSASMKELIQNLSLNGDSFNNQFSFPKSYNQYYGNESNESFMLKGY